MAQDLIENRTFDEIAVGDTASVTRPVTQQDVELYATVSGDVNPAHLDPAYAQTDMFHRVIAHGMLGAGLFSTVLGTRLPGPGTIYLGQDLRFLAPVDIGDTLTATVEVTEKRAPKGDLVLACTCRNQRGDTVISGTAHVRAPHEKVCRPAVELPDVRLSRHERFRTVMQRAAACGALPTAMAWPCDANALGAACEAARAGFVSPILVGPAKRLASLAEAAHLDISGMRIVEADTQSTAAARAVDLIKSGEAAMLMKGSLHTDELLHAVLAGLPHGGRRLSHVYLMDVPTYPRPLLLTDAAVNIAPDLAAKRDIVRNAIDLAHVMQIDRPRVALLSAVETVTAKLQSTLDAAALCKMADRGQITGGVLDGPLAFDNAVSPQAAADKGIVSEVAGRADILLAPDLEAGNMLAKQLTFLANADAAGVVLGARVPIVLTSRADAERTRLASCAVGVLMAAARNAVCALAEE